APDRSALPSTAPSLAGAATVTPVQPPRVPRARPAWFRAAPDSLRKGVYVAEYYTNAILGYQWATRENRPPICSIPATFVVNVTTDPLGNLVDPDGGARSVNVFRGPNMCGPQVGSFADNDGQPSDAATTDAATGTIYVANLQAAGQAYGNVSVCALAGGCTRKRGNKAIGGQLFAVAEDQHGNVYASGYANASGSGASLVVWKGGQGSGARLKAYRNGSPGGLDVDKQGRLLALDTFANGNGALYVYTGCPTHCTAHGPFALKGESVFGKVNAGGTLFEAADFEYGQIDVYSYAGTKGITYLYSFSDGLTPSGDVEGIALSPAAFD
ncbi:MAG TPA: hypothetical protein VFU90_11505, partial [Candidatus Tumulicola sp.]|nr:hypothetical protein [Candidatus Tumulicola sp.]